VAGLSAALWCDELGLDTLVIEEADEVGGQLHSVYNPINNYPACSFLNGEEFLNQFSKQIDAADFDLWTGARVDQVDLKAKRVTLASGEVLQSIAMIIACGVRRRELGIPGEKEFIGKGIIESGARDHDRFKGEDVCVIGGGDAAVENAIILSKVCPTVTLVHRRRTLKARQQFVEQLHTNHCITVFTESVVTRILGNDHVEAVEIRRKDAIKPFQLAVRGVLIRIGLVPNTELIGEQLHLDQKGYIVVTAEQETSVENVFAVGDVSNPLAPTISSAVGAAATAAKVIASRLVTR
jgi:thioredoxin reductase (NADPH)